ncbi:phosphoenolpyruvate--protein phosphotransferase [Pseudonocardia acaciae]|uniref:phosphoenolpyruvate--protein phosphotransferase n=1 Tax=Pseudonocardia acaciae TaxID=551276 RepID=UPI00068826E7|nr:phosphoenolpyruvate--protein phosphotransferase [Pseudonocardia acaciae]
MAEVGLVVVSHSRPLARAAVALASEMLHGDRARIGIAAGLDETTFGTDAAQIVEAISEVDRGDGVAVLMDLGSAVLSAELALELLDDEVRARVALCPAPLVEGLVVAAVAAAGGASLAEVAAEAQSALAGKTAQLAPPDSPPTGTDTEPSDEPAGAVSGVFTLANEHGLHARPAARLVGLIGRYDATGELRNRTTGSPWVPASSLSRIATLGALPGHEIELRTTGAHARAALDDILALAARNFDEPASQAPAPAPSQPAARPQRTHGPMPASPGIGIGPARTPGASVIEIPTDDDTAADPTAERHRLDRAIATVRDDIARLRARTAADLDEPEAAIFDAHLLLLDDTDLLHQVRTNIDTGRSAPRSWAEAIAALSDQLAALPDPYQQARAADARAVGDQVLRALLGDNARTHTAAPKPPGVLVAAELTPAQAAELDPATVTAVLLAYDSPTAHAAILLRAKGIPAVVTAGPAVLDIAEDAPLVVDGTLGEFVINPPPATQRSYRDRAAQLADAAERALAHATEPAATRDGVHIAVGANIGSLDDAVAAARLGADHAGLVRTEFLFLGRADPPGVDEQEAIYRDIADALGGRRITLRTLDVGGDKPLRYLPAPAEANPYLGVRGIRLSLAHPRLLADQLLAIARLAHDTPVSVMFPMVATLDELLAARRRLDDAVARVGRGHPDGLEVGIMVEIPAAALKAAAFAPHVDFMSIGTNDLTQYAMAADRNNDAVATLGDPYDPGVLRLIDATCRGAEGHATVAVCGELAADEPAATLLTGLGVRELSVTPHAIPATKQAVRALDTRDAARLARAALAAPDAHTARESVPPTGHHRA